jgi:2-deoxy-D-gluconate 3-dehydrogenase
MSQQDRSNAQEPQDHQSSSGAFRLDGKVAIVTGASKGIGAEIAIALAEHGAQVVLVSRSNLPSTLTDTLHATNQAFRHIAADMSVMPSIAHVVDETLKHFGQIDILVNNAGAIRRRAFMDHTEEDWDIVLNTSLKVPFFLAQACTRHMLQRGQGGKIINMCSLTSHQGGILIPGYSAAKHGLAGVTKAMANELATHGINVNGIAPGYILTDQTTPLQADETRYQAILSRIPQGRWGLPSDITGAAIFLASRASNYVNGTILDVDGGWMGR